MRDGYKICNENIANERAKLTADGLTDAQIDEYIKEYATNGVVITDIFEHFLKHRTDLDINQCVSNISVHQHGLEGVKLAKERIENGEDLDEILEIYSDHYFIVWNDPIYERHRVTLNSRFNKSPSMQIHFLRRICCLISHSKHVLPYVSHQPLNLAFQATDQDVLLAFRKIGGPLRPFNVLPITDNDLAVLRYLRHYLETKDARWAPLPGRLSLETKDDQSCLERHLQNILLAWHRGENVLCAILAN